VPKPLLIVDFVASGHHALHIRHLIRYGSCDDRATVTFLITRELYDRVLTQLTPSESAMFRDRSRILEEDHTWRSIRRRIKNDWAARFIYVEYLNLFESCEYSLCFLFFETAVYQIALCPLPRFGVSGLMFRPTFYYHRNGMLQTGLRNRAVVLIKWLAAYACAKRPGITRVLTLDPLSQEHARRHWNSSKFQAIPDPLGPEPGVHCPTEPSEAESGKHLTLLIAGSLSTRKGISEVIQALVRTPEQIRRSVVLHVVGHPENGQLEHIKKALQQLEGAGGKLLSDLRFVTDRELDGYIRQADAVLTVYRDFKGSSGILIRAAHFGKPVISSDAGLLGYLVRRNKLGQTVNVKHSETLVASLEQLVLTGTIAGFDPMAARRFADSSDPALFARSILNG